MSVELLVDVFERIAEAPDAVPRLRQFVLDLAVQGRLREPDEMLAPMGVREIEPPWDIPEFWSVVPLSGLAGPGGIFADGDWVESKDQDPEGEVRLTQLADVGSGQFRDRSSRFMRRDVAERLKCTFLKMGDILIARMPDPIGRACIFPGDPRPCVTVVDVALIRSTRSDVESSYVVHALNSSLFRALVLQKAAGTTRQRISRGNLGRLPFPLPPVTEQRRIVAKVDEVMDVCDQLEAAQVKRDRRRDRLALASLAELGSGDREDDASHSEARLYLANFASWSTNAKYINALREAIRNAALHGRLAKQDEADGSAAETVEHAYRDREEAFGSGRLKPISHIPECADLRGWSIPDTWLAVPLPAVVYFQEGPGLRNWQFRPKGIPFLNIRTLQDGKINRGLCQFLDNAEVEAKYRHFLVREGDILCSTSGTIGKLAVASASDLPLMLNTSIVRFSPYGKDVPLPDYIKLFLGSRCFLEQAGESITGSAQVNMGPSHLKRMAFPVPPLAEQHRIVAKVAELMAVCDQLEQRLAAVDTGRARLLSALLHEALRERGAEPAGMSAEAR